MMEFYEGESLAQIFVITGIIGGGAAWLAGRAIAQTWRPLWHVVGYMLLLGFAVRFAHFALGSGTLVSLPSYLTDTLFLVAVGCLGWRVTRATQMVTQYPWLYERSGPMSWRSKKSNGPTPADP
jgi:hypothetical protein